jgi:TonB family protein
MRRRLSTRCLCLALAFGGPTRAETPTATVTPPALTGFVAADYPPSAAAERRGATVVLRLQIGPDGVVEAAEVVSSADPAFDEAALAAARRFTFTPARDGETPIRVRILYRYHFVPPEPPPAHASLTGLVRDAGAPTGRAGVRIRLEDGRETLTDAEGRFAFDGLVAGRHTLTLTAPDGVAVTVVESVEAGQHIEATYELAETQDADADAEGEAPAESDDLEVFVRAPVVRREAVVTQVDAEAARRLPGTQGDVVKVVEAMPGVGRATSGSGALIVWGAAPDETRIYFDDVPLPRLYHDGGARTVLGSELVAGVDLAPGAYGAAYGRGLGGLVRVEGRALEETDTRVHGFVAADVFDTGAGLRTRLTDRLFLGGTVRIGHLDAVVDRFVDPETRGLIPAPRSRDAHLRLTLAGESGARTEAFVLYSDDESLRRVTRPEDPARDLAERRRGGFDRLALRHRTGSTDGRVLTLTLFVGRDQEAAADVFGPIETATRRAADVGGLRLSLSEPVAAGVTLEAGLDVEASSAGLRRVGALTQPPREGDPRIFGRPPPVDIAVDTWDVQQVGVAPYLSARLSFAADTLTLEPGLRLDPLVRRTSRRDPPEGDTPRIGLMRHDLAFEPRLSVRWAPDPIFGLVAAAGRYHQAPADRDLSAVSGNPTLPVARADHLLGGLRFTPTPEQSVELTGFGRWSESQAVRSAQPSPASAEALTADGEGWTRGVQLMLRGQSAATLDGTPRWLGWLSYALSRSERRDARGRWRPSDLDQTHVTTFVGSFTPASGYEIGTRLRLASGFPETPIEGTYFDATRDRFEPVFGAVGSARRPLFFQWDLRIARAITFGDADSTGAGASRLEFWFEVQNVTNHENVETWVYSADYRQRAALTGLPVLPFFGLRWSR